jgi:hypothetical protein
MTPENITLRKDAKNGGQDLGEDETKMANIEKHHTWLPEAKNGEHDPAGEDEKHHTWLHDAKNAVCEVCGQSFTWSGRGQPARYCSRTCQMKATASGSRRRMHLVRVNRYPRLRRGQR